MKHDPATILRVLDDCAGSFTFPMLDNGYVYLAASRLSLFRSDSDWGMVIEIFGFSPRAGVPDLLVNSFASVLHDRDPRGNYVTPEAYQNYLSNNPNNESRFFHPIEDGPWIDDEEFVADDGELLLRGTRLALPTQSEYAGYGIEISEDRPSVFELTRLLAATHRTQVLATDIERRVSIFPDMNELLRLDEWHHPDLASDELPSQSETFQQLAQVLASGDPALYRPTEEANTHWSNWPDGGTL